MPGSLAPILAPPQTLDSLDAWGELDGLPFSLDSRCWLEVGLYGLTLANTLSSTQQANWHRVRTHALTGHAGAGGSCTGQAIFELEGSGKGSAGAEIIGGITVGIPLEPSAVRAGHTVKPVRIRPGEISQAAQGRDHLEWARVHAAVLRSSAATGGEAVCWRLLLLSCSGQSVLDGQIRPEYKGWGWRRLPDSNTEWRGIVEWQ